MLKPTDIQAILDNAKTAIANINFVKVLVVEDELKDYIRDISEEDKMMLIAILPSAQGGGDDPINFDNPILFFVLEKLSKRDLSETEYIDLFARTQATILEFYNFIKSSKCTSAEQLDTTKFNVDPERNYFGSNGYSLAVNFKTYG